MPIQFLSGKKRGTRTVKAVDQYDLSITSLVFEDKNLLLIVETKGEIVSQSDLATLQYFNLIVLEIKSKTTAEVLIKHLETIKQNL
jgi:hypothetical protein